MLQVPSTQICVFLAESLSCFQAILMHNDFSPVNLVVDGMQSLRLIEHFMQ